MSKEPILACKRRHEMPFGATVLDGGGTRFRFWAPGQRNVTLEVLSDGHTQRHAMQRLDGGWHECTVHDAGAGTRYRYRLDDGLAVPDPASRSNPDDVHGPSEVIDPRHHDWHDTAWRGRPWHEAVVYELHVGTFTPQGTFAAAARRLPELAALGVTAIELMPLADFPGRRGWGYDGVLHYAPDAAYGPPGSLKTLIETAHGLGLMVLLDVVYNHFGPEGNYLHAYCQPFFNPDRHTPWGAAINFDGEHSRTVRDYFVHNALYWIEEYHFDGLRMDAVHAILDESSEHIVREIVRRVQEGPGRERQIHVVLENEENSVARLEGHGGATAQWNDDFHHGVHVLLTGERDGYYAAYADRPLAHIGRALAEGFVFQGQASVLHDGAPRGEPSAHVRPTAFVSALQTHDQVGNRAFGERLSVMADRRLLDAAYVCLLLSPHVPMLFMGEEFDASTPFLYFCDFGPELASAVTKGRREEFKRFSIFADPATRERIPDPNDEATFLASCLQWEERDRLAHAQRLAHTRELLALRHHQLVPLLAKTTRGDGRYHVDGALLCVQWTLADGVRWNLLAHFGHHPLRLQAMPPGDPIYVHGIDADAVALHAAPGGVCVTCERSHD